MNLRQLTPEEQWAMIHTFILAVYPASSLKQVRDRISRIYDLLEELGLEDQ